MSSYAIKLHGELRARAWSVRDAAIIALALSAEHDESIHVHHGQKSVTVKAAARAPRLSTMHIDHAHTALVSNLG